MADGAHDEAGPRPVVDGDISAVPHRDVARDGESQAGATAVTGAGFVQAGEAVEHTGSVGRRDAGPVIAHGYFQWQAEALLFFISGNRRGYLHPRPITRGEHDFTALRGDCVGRVAHDVHERLNEAVAVT